MTKHYKHTDSNHILIQRKTGLFLNYYKILQALQESTRLNLPVFPDLSCREKKKKHV